MIRVFVAQHPTEAHLVAGLLGDAGIATEVRGEALFTSRGGVPVTPETLPSVWVVDDAQAEAASQLLEAHAARTAAGVGAEQPWRCEQCGETVEAQFTHCWKCEAPRPSR